MKAKRKQLSEMGRRLAILEQETNDLRRLQDITQELNELTDDETDVAEMVKKAPRVCALITEAERLVKKNHFSSEIVTTMKFLAKLSPYQEIYHIRVNTKQDVVRTVKIWKSQQLRKHQEEAHAPKDVLCAKCNKRPRRINEYCKRCAREEGIIVKGKII